MKPLFPLAVVLLITLNAAWIFLSEPVISNEDLFLIQHVDNIYRGQFGTQNFFIADYEPVPLLAFSSIYALFGPHARPLLIFNTLILAAVLALLNWHLKSSKVVFLLLGFPATIYLSRTLYPEMILLFFFAASLIFLERSHNFKNRKYSILFGISLGLFALTRYLSVIYIIPILAYTLFKQKPALTKFRTPLIALTFFFLSISLPIGIVLVLAAILLYFTAKEKDNFALALSLFIILASLWYPKNFAGKMLLGLWSAKTYGFPLLSLGNLAWYPLNLIFGLASLLYAIYIICLLSKARKFPLLHVLLLAVPLILLTAYPTKNPHSFFLSLVPLSLIASQKLRTLPAVPLLFFIFSIAFFVPDPNLSLPIKIPYPSMDPVMTYTFTDAPVLSRSQTTLAMLMPDTKLNLISKPYHRHFASSIRENASVLSLAIEGYHTKSVLAHVLLEADVRGVRVTDFSEVDLSIMSAEEYVDGFDYVIYSESVDFSDEFINSYDLNQVNDYLKRSGPVPLYNISGLILAEVSKH